jgi:hypothetical protein
MLRDIIRKLATCHIFWAADFVDFTSGVTECYTDIENIKNYGMFVCTPVDVSSVKRSCWYKYVSVVSLTIVKFYYKKCRWNWNLRFLLLQNFHEGVKVQLMVATTMTTPLMTLTPQMWKMTASFKKKKTPLLAMNSSGEFPKPLKEKYLEQLHKVYSKCVAVSEYLPQLFTAQNSRTILGSSMYAAEIPRDLTAYTAFNDDLPPQHCRHKGTLCLISLFVTVCISPLWQAHFIR